MMTKLKRPALKEFPLLIKGDVQGSVEAIVGALDKLGTDEVAARIVCGRRRHHRKRRVLAESSGAAIIGFNVRANAQARDAAEREGVEIRYYAIIYDLVDDVKAAVGHAGAEPAREVPRQRRDPQVFDISKVGKVAGCRVTEGKVERGARSALIRDNVVVHEGKLSTLKRFKDEVREVMAGQECGMAFEGYQDMRQGDVIECFEVEHVQRTWLS